ncbi:MAG: BamA/TamA family outer membrane protein [Candidatus Marinimicrobia bacterium]|nr:BamA/TamA family outer membrane protein [Candidatus Neomarinimicrobiota bacterium]
MKILRQIFILLLLVFNLSFAQFGQNKVQYDVFDWNFIQSKHFNIYFNGENKTISDFCAQTAESSYESLSTLFDWDLKKRYAIIVYDSHNDFQQTNTTNSYMPEGVGGFTELFKNRVVVPFEGSYSDFRHVIHHELIHAFMNDLYYSGSIQSIISGAVRLNIPLWLAEGSAEYESSRWDTEADMFMRDFTYNSQFEAYPLEALTGYYAYKGGQSIFKFIRETYGYQKLTEFYTKLKIYLDVEKGIQYTFNMSKEEFTEEWHHYLKKMYWPDISMSEDIREISVRLTDHKKMKNIQNIAPAISPSGSRIAFLSDRKGYADIYLMDVQDGKRMKRLVKGQRKASLEELKWMSPGISWSADSEHIVFAAKSGKHDALVVVDVKSGKQDFYPMPELQGVFSAAYHPNDNNIIAFSGHNGAQSDIFVYDLQTGILVNLTQDTQGDENPQWSPDGKNIVYVSERLKAKDVRDVRHPYQSDIYMVNVGSKAKTARTNTDHDENYPYMDPQGRGFIYTSDANGIKNIYIQPNEGEAYPITNVVGGIFHLNLDRTGDNLIFCAFKDYGWDIFRMNYPFEIEKKELHKTRYKIESTDMPFDITEVIMKKERIRRLAEDIKPEDEKVRIVKGDDEIQRLSDYADYVFIPEYAYGMDSPDSQIVALDSTEIIDDAGSYIDKPYKTKFSLDLVDSQFGFSTFYGVQGQATFMFSDVMGDHQVYIGTDLYIDLQNSDYAMAYYYRRYRTNFGFVIQNQSDNYAMYIPGEVSTTNPFGYFVTRYTNRSVNFMVDYPINKHHRIELNNSYYYVKRELLDTNRVIIDQYDEDIHEYRAEIALVKDNTIFSYTGPMDGNRYRLSFEMSPKITPETPEFYTAKIDYRQYFKITNNYHLAFRFNGGASFGPDPQTFLLGGIDNWINYVYNPDAPIFGNDGDNFSEQLSMYYLSEYIMPVRGATMFQTWGDKFMLFNAELRFPFIEYAKFGLPPVQFFQVRGVLFADVGAAWTDSLQLVENGAWMIGNTWDDMIGSLGVGIRVYLGFALLRIDCAWEYNGDGFSSPRWLWSLGGDL